MHTYTAKRLTTAILVALTGMSTIPAEAAETTEDHAAVQHYEAPDITVSAPQRGTSYGIVAREASLEPLGENTDILEAPMNVVAYHPQIFTQSALPTRTFLNAATNNPSVMVGGASTDNNVELQIRGIPFNTHDILLDGVPGMIMMQHQPTNYIGRMEIIAGPNAVISGTGLQQSASGLVNFVPKEAQNHSNLDIAESYSSSRYFTHSMDWGQRFGKDGAWGVRINAESSAGATTMTGEDLRQKDFYINIDHRGKESKSAFLFGYDTANHHGMPEVLRISNADWGTNIAHLPNAKNVVKNFMPRWAWIAHTHRVYLLRHEQQVGTHLNAYLKVGLMDRAWPGYVTAKPYLKNDAGDYTLSIDGSSTMGKTSRRVFMTGLKLDARTGSIEHDITLGYDYLSQHSWSNYAPGTISNLRGNIYTGLTLDPGAPLAPKGQWYVNAKTNNRSIVLADAMTALDGRLKIFAGIRQQTIETRSLQRTSGSETKKYHARATVPTFGILYKLSPRTSVYANYAESIGTVSPPSTAINKGEAMPPVRTKQIEIGAKWDMDTWASTLSLFCIQQPTGITNSQNYFVLDGETESRGIEWNAFGQIAPRLSATGGLMLLDTAYKRTQGGLTDGNRAYGTPCINATMALNWETKAKGLNLYARTHHFGSSYADSRNRIKVPSWTRVDLGASWKTHAFGSPATLNFTVYNLFNKMYWSTTTGKWSDGGLMLNPGRTYMLSAIVSL